MNNKTRKQLEAWREAMQRDLNRKNYLWEQGVVYDETYGEEWERLRTSLNQAVAFLFRKFNVIVTFSQGEKVCMDTRDKDGCLVTI